MTEAIRVPSATTSTHRLVIEFVHECQRNGEYPTRQLLEERFPCMRWKTLACYRSTAMNGRERERVASKFTLPSRYRQGLPTETEKDRQRIERRIKAARKLKERGIWPVVERASQPAFELRPVRHRKWRRYV